MVHLSGTVIAILGWAATFGAVAVAYILSGRAGAIQARATTAAVDASAYERARGIYEGAIHQLQAELADVRQQLAEVRQDNVTLMGRVHDLERALAAATGGQPGAS
jgi:hypothetical protein